MKQQLECAFCGAPVIDDHGPRYDSSVVRRETVESIRRAIDNAQMDCDGDISALLDEEAQS